jgi:hypothetical protein
MRVARYARLAAKLLAFIPAAPNEIIPNASLFHQIQF